MSETSQNGNTSSGELNVEWSYSGKALRAQAILFALVSLALVGGGLYATIAKLIPDSNYLLFWIAVFVCVLCIWGYHYTVFFYRTYTIRYKLTERYLYADRGLFTQIRDTTELIHIDDVQLIQTLFDRIFNGGVGRLVIFCAADKTDTKMTLRGIDKPREIFESINSARTALRAKRSILNVGG
jgi:uncharacterized membrane protein YdbT with pleckstrin-like domain